MENEEIKIKRKRGRPRNPTNLEDREDAVILKWLAGEPMTLDETALAIWMIEGRKTSKPLSKVQVLNLERSALKKLQEGFAKIGIKNLDDVFFPSKERYAFVNKLNNDIDDNWD